MCSGGQERFDKEDVTLSLTRGNRNPENTEGGRDGLEICSGTEEK